MSSKNKTTLSGLVFILVFVLQQIMSFVSIPFSFSLYWFLIIFIVLIIGFKLPLINKKYKAPFFFMIICVIGAVLSYLNGVSIGFTLTKVFYSVFAYIGFIYISEKRINIRIFSLLLLFLYIYFYFTYYSLNEGLRKALDRDLFGHSSSNTIPITLNIVLIFYYILSKYYNENNNLWLLIFSIFNMFLIIVQESRGGILVAGILLILTISNISNFKMKRKYTTFLFISIIFSFLIYLNLDRLADVIDINSMQGLKSYREDIRGEARIAFFDKMDFSSFLLGYPGEFEFTYGITRTFNAFLDFWNRFGFIPFVYLIILFFIRIIRHKQFSLSLIYFFPILVYSLFESIWGGTMWDILIYIFLFYSFKNENHLSNNLSILELNRDSVGSTHNGKITKIPKIV